MQGNYISKYAHAFSLSDCPPAILKVHTMLSVSFLLPVFRPRFQSRGVHTWCGPAWATKRIHQPWSLQALLPPLGHVCKSLTVPSVQDTVRPTRQGSACPSRAVQAGLDPGRRRAGVRLPTARPRQEQTLPSSAPWRSQGRPHREIHQRCRGYWPENQRLWGLFPGCRSSAVWAVDFCCLDI